MKNNFKKTAGRCVAAALSAFILCGAFSEFRLCAADSSREEILSAKAQPVSVKMDWAFVSYSEPDFTSREQGVFSAQTIEVLEKKGGWGKIMVFDEPQWVYLARNLRYIRKYTAVYESINGEEFTDILSPQLVEITEQDGEWVKVKTWAGDKWLELGSVSPEVLLDIPATNQHELGYPTGCEMISLSMMINYATGEPANLDEIYEKLPRSFNPAFGFRGDPKTEAGFSIYPTALRDLAEEYLGNAQIITGCDMDFLKDKLAQGIPVIIWVNGLGFNVHAFCLSGYDEKGFYYNDPWNGRKDRFITYNAFYGAWNNPVYDEQLNREAPPRMALSYENETGDVKE
ncbi:MAG: C39 family peptidase [Clostridiales bacterium]|jgi:uncharacterized protein YvpB|nr:C39 family peptidase [Clostridiales bacterium]